MSVPGTKQTYESGAMLSAQQHNKDVPGMKGHLLGRKPKLVRSLVENDPEG